MGKLLRLWVVVATSLAVAFPALAQQRGVIRGTVTAQAGGQPLVGATITVGGTALRGVTGQQGEYRIGNVPAGTHDVTATILGYSPRSQRVTLAAGQTATASFTLEASALEIGGLVVTATGREQRQRELGNVVSNIQIADVPLAATTSFSQVIQGRAPGVSVLQTSGTVGGTSRIRIRGNNSVSLSNSPLLIIDGVRVNDNTASFGLFTGGQDISRLDDINPEDIESIEILKGPAAAALYGTAAANGVIQVTTKRGRPGRARWRAYVEGSTMEQRAEFPDNFRAVNAAGQTCSIIERGLGLSRCAAGVAEVHQFNPLAQPETNPFRDGSTRKFGMSVSGGSEAASYYVSLDRENETGVQIENEAESMNLRANVSGQVTDNFKFTIASGYVNRDVQLPQNDNSALGPILNALLADPRPGNVTGPNQGFRLPYAYFFAWDQFQDIQRFTTSGNLEYRPLPWLSFNGVAGLDFLNRFDNGIVEPGVLLRFGPPFSVGLREQWRVQNFQYTANFGATATRSLLESLESTTSAGVQYTEEEFNTTFASAQGITPGTRITAEPRSVSESFGENITVGAYAQQQFAWQDRLFLTGAVRGDRNSAFGTDLGFVWYPSVSASWVLSEEPFFPDAAQFVSNLRLRAAYGKSGLRPGLRDALRFFSGVAAPVAGQVQPGFVIRAAGNPELRPEISTELELGVDLGLLDNRLGVEFTRYNKRSEDALINRELAPSVGISPIDLETPGRFENIGEVKNSGYEVLLRAEPIRRPNFSADFQVSGSWNDNELVELGKDVSPIVFGLISSQRHVPGFQLGSYFARPLESFSDANGNGFIERSEVVLGDTAAFLGNPFPDREFSFNANVRLFDFARVSALFDHKGGYQLFNTTQYRRCVFSTATCEERHVPTEANQDVQAAIVAFENFGTFAGFVEDADFTRFRELALTLSVPSRLTRRVGLGSDALSLTVAGRNLATWTEYTGFDPEVNYAGGANFTSADFFTLPPARVFTARIDVNF